MNPQLFSSATRTLKVFRRVLSSGNGDIIRPAFYKVKTKQKKFTQDDGLPVHLKGGIVDQILFKLTFLGCLAGSAWGLKTIIWDLSLDKWLKS